MSMNPRIPENYDLRRIVEALIEELEEREALDRGRTNVRIIEKGNPNPNEFFERLKAQSNDKSSKKKDGNS